MLENIPVCRILVHVTYSFFYQPYDSVTSSTLISSSSEAGAASMLAFFASGIVCVATETGATWLAGVVVAISACIGEGWLSGIDKGTWPVFTPFLVASKRALISFLKTLSFSLKLKFCFLRSSLSLVVSFDFFSKFWWKERRIKITHNKVIYFGVVKTWKHKIFWGCQDMKT